MAADTCPSVVPVASPESARQTKLLGMLSATSLSVVRQTLPAVAAAIPEITTLFYGKLFADHPELLSDLFNRGNQATGAQQQALVPAGDAAHRSFLRVSFLLKILQS